MSWLGRGARIDRGAHLRTLADVNGDARSDLVLTHATKLSILLNQKQGTFAPASPISLDSEAFQIVAADFNRDGRNDLAAATVNSITVLLNNGRRFTPAAGSPYPAGPGAYCLAAADLNQDGKLDLAASSFEGDFVTVLLGR